MPLSLPQESAFLHRLPVADLRRRYAELFGEPTRAGNRTWLIRRIAWRLQALAQGDLTERARRRAAELAHDADLRLFPPRPSRAQAAGRDRPATFPDRPVPRDDRMPLPGTVLTRPYKGRTLYVTVLAHGFEYEGVRYRSLSGLAKSVTGSHCNGRRFFGLAEKGVKP